MLRIFFGIAKYEDSLVADRAMLLLLNLSYNPSVLSEQLQQTFRVRQLIDAAQDKRYHF